MQLLLLRLRLLLSHFFYLIFSLTFLIFPFPRKPSPPRTNRYQSNYGHPLRPSVLLPAPAAAAAL